MMNFINLRQLCIHKIFPFTKTLEWQIVFQKADQYITFLALDNDIIHDIY